MNFICIKLFYDFRTVIFNRKDCRKTVICSFKRISRMCASIVDYSALFSKEIVKDFSFLFEICNVSSMVIEGARTLFLFLVYIKGRKNRKTKQLFIQTNTKHSKTQNNLQNYSSMTSLLLKDNP